MSELYFKSKTPIIKGWSEDKKYCVIKEDGNKYLLRISKIERFENKELFIIDFDRFDFGDPWEEFNRIVWCVQASPYFATGMVNGYFDGQVPLDFWKLLAFYIASNTLSSIPWSIPFGEDELNIMIKQASDVIEWYDGMENLVPTWYIGK